jgi:3-methyladenine DNA glycosylase/8-oxoguanine DNA glycosylase
VTADLKNVTQFRLNIPTPFDFARTVAKPAGWHWSTLDEVFEGGIFWSAIYLDGEAVGLRMSSSGGSLSVIGYCHSPITLERIALLKTTVRMGLGADEDLAGFYRFAAGDPVLSICIKDLYGMRVGTVNDVFGRVILAILLQMAPMARSSQMMTALLEHYGNRVRFDGKEISLWPRPADLARVPPDELKSKAKLGYRAGRLVQAAQYLTQNPLSLADLARLPEQEALADLRRIPGIGGYSAGIIYGRSSVPLDVWSVVVMSELLLGRTPENPRREIESVIQKVKERWGKWGWLAFVYVLNDLENLAKRYHLTRLQ